LGAEVIVSNSENNADAVVNEGPASGEQYGDYEVIKALASGGMADIFLARKLGVQGFAKLVVIKRIRRELVKDEHLIDMFIDEAHVAAKLDHPNVVVVSDLGEIDDSYFMAMEYLRGQTMRTLQQKLNDAGKMLPPKFWARVLEYALDGLHYAHELRGDDGQLMGLVHRDFTPSNIMITYSGTVKVIDFGVAHVEAPTRHETRVGTIKGKIAYLAPEQCMAQPVDRRADVFAAGIVLWELLSRRKLFDGPSDTANIVAIMTEPIPRPGWGGQPVDPELERIVMKALQREPAHRFQTAAEMREALREYLRRESHKLDASDIAEVMCELFAEERVADEKLATRDPTKGTPLPRDRAGSRHGSKSGVSRSGSRSNGSVGSAAGQQIPLQTSRSKVVPLAAVGILLAGGIGFGVWKFTQKPPVVEPAAQPQMAFAHPPTIPPKQDPPPPKEDPLPPPTKADPPPVEHVAANEKPLEKPTYKPPKHTAPAEPSQQLTGGSGMLDFDTRPYTQVFIGKKKLGDTPLLGVKVPAGKITLTLVNEEAGIRESYTVTVPKDGHVFKKLKL
jgi:eukaryotic-like serine/threonine-protein kinase